MADLSIFFILDGSGSMSDVQNEVVNGLNEFIQDQKDDAQLTGDDVTFSLVVFDYQPSTVYLAEDIESVEPVTKSDTLLGGGTALYDAVGSTLTQKKVSNLKGKKLVVIYTDGEENSSKEFDAKKVNKLIEDLRNQGDWTFVFMGSELEEWQVERTAALMGIAAGNSVTTYGGSTTANVFKGMSMSARDYKMSENTSTTDFYKEYSNPVLDSAIKSKIDEEEELEKVK